MHWSSRCRKPVKVTELFRAIGSVITCPVATCRAATMEMVPLRTYSNSRRASRPGQAASRLFGAHVTKTNALESLVIA